METNEKVKGTRSMFIEALRSSTEVLLSKRYKLHRCFTIREIMDACYNSLNSLEGKRIFQKFCELHKEGKGDDIVNLNDFKALSDTTAYKLYDLYHS